MKLNLNLSMKWKKKYPSYNKNIFKNVDKLNKDHWDMKILNN